MESSKLNNRLQVAGLFGVLAGLVLLIYELRELHGNVALTVVLAS